MILQLRHRHPGAAISLGVLAFLLVFLLVLLCLVLKLYVYPRGYPYSPARFKRQAEILSMAMSKEEVVARIQIYSDRGWTNDGRLVYRLEPLRQGPFVRRTTWFISIEFNERGKLSKVRVYDS